MAGFSFVRWTQIHAWFNFIVSFLLYFLERRQLVLTNNFNLEICILLVSFFLMRKVLVIVMRFKLNQQ
jgi:hypothetical protein